MISHSKAMYVGVVLSCLVARGAAAESLTVTFATSAAGGQYNPRNVVAIYVTGPGDAFVKTIGRWARTRVADLGTWATASGGDADAVMGATRSDHSGTLRVTWDMTNRAGVVVPNGTYTIHFNLADGREKSATLTFNKNGVSANATPTVTGFSTVTTAYVGTDAPATTGGTTGGTSGGTTGGSTGDTTPSEAAGPACGDGIANGNDQCDGTDLAGKGCNQFGFSGGPLGCTPRCMVDISQCIGPQDTRAFHDVPAGGCAAVEGNDSMVLWVAGLAAVVFLSRRRSVR